MKEKIRGAKELVQRGVEWRDSRTYERLTGTSSLTDDLRRVSGYLLAIVLIVLLGAFGYRAIEGWPFFDSLYMTVITVATVGFEEVRPLSPAGRAFTIFLIVLGFGGFTVFYSAIAQFLIQREIFSANKGKRMRDAIAKLSGHTIFCGYGTLTKIAAAELRQSAIKLVIIDIDPEKVAIANSEGYLALEGDATDDEVLLQAGVDRAKRLVAVLPKESDNLYVVLTSRELNPDLFILCRTEGEGGEKRLRRAGADRVISPYRVGGLKIAEGLVRPYVTDFIDLAVSSHRGHLQIEEIRIPEASSLNGQTLKEAAFRQKTHVMVAAIIQPDGKMVFNPDAETVIEGGATFIALGLRNDLRLLEQLLLEQGLTEE